MLSSSRRSSHLSFNKANSILVLFHHSGNMSIQLMYLYSAQVLLILFLHHITLPVSPSIQTLKNTPLLWVWKYHRSWKLLLHYWRSKSKPNLQFQQLHRYALLFFFLSCKSVILSRHPDVLLVPNTQQQILLASTPFCTIFLCLCLNSSNYNFYVIAPIPMKYIEFSQCSTIKKNNNKNPFF